MTGGVVANMDRIEFKLYPQVELTHSCVLLANGGVVAQGETMGKGS